MSEEDLAAFLDQPTAVDELEMMDEIDLTRRGQQVASQGWHDVRIVSVEPRTSGSGKPKLLLRTEIIGETDPDVGMPIFVNLWLTEAARFRLEQFLDAILAPAEGKMKPEQFIGATLRVLVTHREFQQDQTTRIMADANTFAPTGSGGGPPTRPDFVAAKPRPRQRSKPTKSKPEDAERLAKEEDAAKATAAKQPPRKRTRKGKPPKPPAF